MIALEVRARGGRAAFSPGDALEGMATWHFDGDVRALELRLFWYTEGRGDRDVETVEMSGFEAPQAQEERGFSFRLPEGPYSFSGNLITLNWALELVAQPSGDAARLEFTVSPTGRPVSLSGRAANT
jgi:hypothetical protein